MPINANMSREEIIKKEIAAGKSPEQAAAIAYNVAGEGRQSAHDHIKGAGNTESKKKK